MIFFTTDKSIIVATLTFNENHNFITQCKTTTKPIGIMGLSNISYHHTLSVIQ